MTNPVNGAAVSAAMHDLAGMAAAHTSEAALPEPLRSPTVQGLAANTARGNRSAANMRRQASASTPAPQEPAASTPVAAEAASTNADSAHSASLHAASTPAASRHLPTEHAGADAETRNSENTASHGVAVPDDSTGSHPATPPHLHGAHPGPHVESGDMMDQQKMLMKQQK